MRSLEERGLDLDVHLDTVADATRRRLLLELASETDNGAIRLDLTQREDLLESVDSSADLYHHQLPKLADRGYVNWDRERDLVTHGPAFHEIEPVLSVLAEHADEFPGESR